MTPEECAYAAGLFDGEGSVRIRRITAPSVRTPWFQLEVSVYNTDFRVLEWLHERWAGTVTRRVRDPRHSPSGTWRVVSHRAYLFLQAIAPYSIIKRERIEIAQAFQAVRSHHFGPRDIGRDPSADMAAREDLRRANLKVVGR